jgi:EAL and modified HD-GYP domain-containing signal transduction protein
MKSQVVEKMAKDAYMGRQPIVDRQGNIVAYELFYRTGPQKEVKIESDLKASATVLSHLLSNLDSKWLPAGKPVFINADATLLDDADFLSLLPDGKVVLDLHGKVAVTPQILANCDALEARRIFLSIDDCNLGEQHPELLRRASFAKVDVADNDSMALFDKFARIEPFGLKKIAKRVGNGKDYKFCRDLGFDLFQGYFFARPEVVAEREITPGMAQLVQLLNLVGRNADVKEIEAAFRRDPALTVKLLRYINSAGMGVGKRVTSIRQALQLLGYRQLYRWVALLLYTSEGGQTPVAVVKTVLTRSRFIELMGNERQPGQMHDGLFLLGMLSMLDVIFGIPLDEALTKLHMPEPVVRAVLRHEGEQGALLALALAAEEGDAARLAGLSVQCGLASEEINRLHLEAVAWAEALAVP